MVPSTLLGYLPSILQPHRPHADSLMVLALHILFYLPGRLSPLTPQHNHRPCVFHPPFFRSVLPLPRKPFLYSLSRWFSLLCTLLNTTYVSVIARMTIQTGILLRVNSGTIKNYTGTICINRSSQTHRTFGHLFFILTVCLLMFSLNVWLPQISTWACPFCSPSHSPGYHSARSIVDTQYLLVEH